MRKDFRQARFAHGAAAVQEARAATSLGHKHPSSLNDVDGGIPYVRELMHQFAKGKHLLLYAPLSTPDLQWGYTWVSLLSTRTMLPAGDIQNNAGWCSKGKRASCFMLFILCDTWYHTHCVVQQQRVARWSFFAFQAISSRLNRHKDFEKNLSENKILFLRKSRDSGFVGRDTWKSCHHKHRATKI